MRNCGTDAAKKKTVTAAANINAKSANFITIPFSPTAGRTVAAKNITASQNFAVWGSITSPTNLTKSEKPYAAAPTRSMLVREYSSTFPARGFSSFFLQE